MSGVQDQHWYNIVAGLLIVGVLAVSGVAFYLGSISPAASGGSTNGGGTAYVNLTIATNPINGLDQYFPANFTVPSGEAVVITVTNYDTGINNVTGMPYGTSHTFTIPKLDISEAIPHAGEANVPSVTHFTITFPAGQYTWLCEAPCDPNSMAAPGYMSGTVTAI